MVQGSPMPALTKEHQQWASCTWKGTVKNTKKGPGVQNNPKVAPPKSVPSTIIYRALQYIRIPPVDKSAKHRQKTKTYAKTHITCKHKHDLQAHVHRLKVGPISGFLSLDKNGIFLDYYQQFGGRRQIYHLPLENFISIKTSN